MPIVPTKIKIKSNAEGIQKTGVWLKLKNEHKANPVIQIHIPTLEIIAIGLLPVKSATKMRRNDPTHRITPIISVLINSFMELPASKENCAAYTKTTIIPDSC